MKAAKLAFPEYQVSASPSLIFLPSSDGGDVWFSVDDHYKDLKATGGKLISKETQTGRIEYTRYWIDFKKIKKSPLCTIYYKLEGFDYMCELDYHSPFNEMSDQSKEMAEKGFEDMILLHLSKIK